MKFYRDLIIPEIIKSENGSYEFEKRGNGWAYHVKYGTQPKDDPSSLIELDLYATLGPKFIRVDIGFRWDEFNKLSLEEANKLLLSKAHDRIDEYYDKFIKEDDTMKLFSCHLWKQYEMEEAEWSKTYLVQAKDKNEAEEIVEDMKKEWHELNIHSKIYELDMNKRIQSI